MTLTVCIAIYANYHYFGLEDSNQCSYSIDLDPSTKTAEAKCHLKYSGDNSLVHRGTLRLTVYKKDEPPAPPLTPLPQVPSATIRARLTLSVFARSPGRARYKLI